ncbi:MAG: crotonase/enoyl-CoA hydratase family protein [Rhodocyclaceae bacterium]|nr:crotonase/enoyl-CoA hydratase family protein [Rhodocyclaceae bacterium]
MESLVSYELSEGVATITLNDGKVNVLGFAMQEALNAALDKAEADQAVVVLTGNAKVFSAGFDLAVMKAGGPNVPKMMTGGGKIGERLLSFPRPVVLAVNNHAMAMGAILLMCADLRIGSDAGIKVQLNETAIGMVLPHFAIALAHNRLSIKWRNRALVQAEGLDAHKAVAAGFLDEVAPAENFLAYAQERAKGLAALHGASFVATRKRLNERLLADLALAGERDAKEWTQVFGAFQ